jgi:hypothetical protein
MTVLNTRKMSFVKKLCLTRHWLALALGADEGHGVELFRQGGR